MPVLSKPLPLWVFNRDRQNLTRFQVRSIRATFDFLGLSPELRNLVYELCIDFKGVESYFVRCYGKILRHEANPRRCSSKPPAIRAKTPTLFLLNHQIYAEATYFISKKNVTFDYGLLNIKTVERVISANLLRRVQSINITTKGHSVHKSAACSTSWRGYMTLFTNLSDVLSSGHELNNLTIDLEDESLKEHMTSCFVSSIHCDFRDHIIEYTEDLRDIRGVGCVTIKGLPAALSDSLKRRMESKPKPKFFEHDFPAEIRNMIYHYAASYDDPVNHLNDMVADWSPTEKNPIIYPGMSTPTIFRLNKQITREAQDILSKQTLEITLPDTQAMRLQTDVPDLLNFISAQTFQKIKHLTIRIKTWEWIYAVERVLGVLAASHNLTTFRFDFHDALKYKFVRHLTKVYPDRAIATCLDDLTRIAGVGEVVFEGDLPEVYTGPMKAMMQLPRGSGLRAGIPAPKAVRGDGEIVDVELED